jgi:hypothetical protein
VEILAAPRAVGKVAAKPGVVVHTCNPSTWRRLGFTKEFKTGLHREILSQKPMDGGEGRWLHQEWWNR